MVTDAEIKKLARRIDRTPPGPERERLKEELFRKLPELDIWEGISPHARWLAELLARMKWFEWSEN